MAPVGEKGDAAPKVESKSGRRTGLATDSDRVGFESVDEERRDALSVGKGGRKGVFERINNERGGMKRVKEAKEWSRKKNEADDEDARITVPA